MFSAELLWGNSKSNCYIKESMNIDCINALTHHANTTISSLGLNGQPGAPVTERHRLVKACPWPKWQSQSEPRRCVTQEKKHTGSALCAVPHAAAKAHFSRQGLPGHHTNNFFLRKQDLRPFQATEIRVPHLPKLKVLLISLNMTLIARAWEMTHLTNNAPLWISKPTILAVLKKMIKIAWMP